MTQRRWLPIAYRDFYDIPRMVAVTIGDTIYLLDCRFDESLNDYPSFFEVYELPPELEERLRDPGYAWDRLRAMGSRVGRVPVNLVEFDASRR